MRPILPILLLSLVVACDDKAPEPPGKPQPTAAGNKSLTKPITRKPSGSATPKPQAGAIAWQKPNAWELVDHPSRMRKATYKVTVEDGDAEMSVTQVGGGIDANIQRWEKQFEGGPKAKTEKKKVAGLDVTIVEIEGKFMGGMRPAMGLDAKPQDGWALLAAIVHTEPAHFFKMTGPAKTVKGSRGDFDALVGSIAKK